MTTNRKLNKGRIPVRFVDEDAANTAANETVEPKVGAGGDAKSNDSPKGKGKAASEASAAAAVEIEDQPADDIIEEATLEVAADELTDAASDDRTAPVMIGQDDLELLDDELEEVAPSAGAGPMLAELLATRSELKRVEAELHDQQEKLARRQADFDNFRKRNVRERSETYQKMVGEMVGKLLPVVDNLRRALDAEASIEATESEEFRHFLRGVELIYKQLNGVLEGLGVEPVPAIGQPFNPLLHEAVSVETRDDFEPDTVTQELQRGYRLGERLLRPAMVIVSTK